MINQHLMLGMERGTSEKVRKFVRNLDFPVVCITILLLQWFWQIVVCLLIFEFDIQRAVHHHVFF